MSVKTGFQGYLYYGDQVLSDSVAPSAVSWTELGNATDVTTDLNKDRVEKTTRTDARTGYKTFVTTTASGTITTQLNFDEDDSDLETLEDAWYDGTIMSFCALSGAVGTTGSRGLAGNFEVQNFSRSEPRDGVMTVDVELAPSSQLQKYEVA